MSCIKVTAKGDFRKVNTFIEKLTEKIHLGKLDKYGKMGVEALSKNTPIDTGTTADSWYYKIERTENSVSLIFGNENIQNDVPIAIILQYGHATGTGGWVEGRDYINPAVQPIFDEILDTMWKEVKQL